MSKRTRQRFEEEAIANASDPEDGDWGAPSARPTPRRKGQGSAKHRPKKRRRRASGDSDMDDEDELASEGSFLEGSEEEEEEDRQAELNPATGRPMRSAARKSVNYEESDEDEVEDSDLEAVKKEPSSRPSTRGNPKPSLIVKLPVTMSPRSLRSRRGSRPSNQYPTSPVTGKRRSSRLSHDDTDPIVALTNSGKHTVIVRDGTRSPSAEPVQPVHRTRGGKGPKKMPSAIMEASQETSGPSQFTAHADAQGGAEHSEVVEEMVLESAQNSKPPSVQGDTAHIDVETEQIVLESTHEEDDDEGPVTRRSLRARTSTDARATRTLRKRRRAGPEESSDFEPTVEDEEKHEEELTDSDEAGDSPRKSSKETSVDSNGARRSRRLAGRTRASQQDEGSGHESELDQDELAEEADALAAEANSGRRKRRRVNPGIVYDERPKLRTRGNKPDYRTFRPELAFQPDDEEPAPQVTPQKRGRGANGAYRSLFNIQGPFGGAIGMPSAFGGAPAAGGADSDSSDDDMPQRAVRGMGGAVGMTPTSAIPPANLLSNNPDQLPPGAPVHHGKVKDKKLLADADPLGVDQNVNFDGVGGLDGHIDQLKEMVALPLLYPEVFQRFHVTPPRGVLFHGPPGTGKTLLARALASSVSAHGQKVTFYMRKGADALSKWVGEAEKQLRLLFEEARKTQPSIIFFDEIDGLAPVRSSKQEQIHASIVATLLALMDGMDGRGQVIVIGATNRPDSVDPALRRPGRFDREFYFPLPNLEARRSILDIHTKGWDPPLQPKFKDSLAALTKGYGGADLRALCTEAALNAVQGTFPQIYQSDKKLIIDPSQIKVLAKDFMISVNKMVPSSERAASAGAAPLSKEIEPLLREPMRQIAAILDDMIPQKKRLTPLEEAQFDDREDDKGFEREVLAQGFERARVFRPRLLISGLQGMGQAYIGAALLNRFERMHVQSFDLPSLLEDTTRSPEATVIQFFKEVRRHKPSVIYIPNVDVWYQTVGPQVIRTFTTLLRSLPPNDAVLVLGVLETSVPDEELDPDMLRDLFGFSKKNQFQLSRPDEAARREYFNGVISYIRMPPSDFPTAENRKKRKIPQLPVAPEPERQSAPTKEDLKAQRKRDRLTLNILRLHLQPIMDQIKLKHRKFRSPVVDEHLYSYLFDEQDPGVLSTDLTEEQRQAQRLQRPFELANDKKGVPGIREVATGNFYYNVDIVMIERRLSNGYYKRGKDFLADIKRLVADSKTANDHERTLKANELLSTVEVDLETMKYSNPTLFEDCESVFRREQQREELEAEKARHAAAAAGQQVTILESNVPPRISGTTTQTSGPIVLGEPIPGPHTYPPVTPIRRILQSDLSNGVSSTEAPQSNGVTIPSRPQEDVAMVDADDEVAPATQGQSSYQSLYTPSVAAHSQTRPSQEGPHTQVSKDYRPGDYHNSASTTTSGQKTDRSSGATGLHFNTQSSNGRSYGHSQHPDLASIHQPMSGGSQLPDTQVTSSQSSSQPGRPTTATGPSPFPDPASALPPPDSQMAHGQPTSAPPVSRATNGGIGAIASILNDNNNDIHPHQSGPAAAAVGSSQSQSQHSVPTPTSSDPSSVFVTPHPPFSLDTVLLDRLHTELTESSSGLSVEQLEQVNAALMDSIWRQRGQWNRNLVLKEVLSAFNAEIADIEEMQRILPPSQKWSKDAQSEHAEPGRGPELYDANPAQMLER